MTYATAPADASHCSVTWPLPPVADRFVGAGGALQAVTALFTLRRPPVTVMPVIDGIRSTLPRIRLLRLAVFIGQADNTSAAAPETCGVAIDVPLKKS